MRDAHESGDESTLRQVIVFRLRPLNPLPVKLPEIPITKASKTTVKFIPVERQHTRSGVAAPGGKPYEYKREEASIVHDYTSYLMDLGHSVGRLEIHPEGEVAPIYCDLWDETTCELVEAKSRATREAMRLAVGQLMDYGRFVDAKARKTVLVPSPPRDDLLAYLRSAGVSVVYPDGDSWRRVEPAPQM